MLPALLSIFTIYNSYSFEFKGNVIKDSPEVFEQIAKEFRKCSGSVTIDYIKEDSSRALLSQVSIINKSHLITVKKRFKYMSKYKQYFLILHELGHIKGLGHSDREEDIMYIATNSNHDFKNYNVSCFKKKRFNIIE